MEPEGFAHVSPEDVARYDDVVNKLYDEIDRCLGKIIAATPRVADVILVSDHGFQPAPLQTRGAETRIRT